VAADATPAGIELGDRHVIDHQTIEIEMLEIAERHGLIAYQALAHMLAVRGAVIARDRAALRKHLDAARQIISRYQLNHLLNRAWFSEGMLAHVAGDLETAERVYLEAGEHLRSVGGFDADLITLVGITTLRVTAGRMGELLPALRQQQPRLGTVVADRLALGLAELGDIEAAREARREVAPIGLDFLWSLRTGLRGMAVVATQDRDHAAELYDTLLPYHDQLPGASTAWFVLNPMAQILGDLAMLLDRPDTAREHYTEALRVAETWEAPIWIEQARERLNRVANASA
jgi:tetratricopeptide (TPR) repeat protein